MTTWSANPHQGDFNAGTKIGHSIFLKKTAGPEDSERFSLQKEDAPKIYRFLRSREPLLGKVINSIPIEIDDRGAVVKTANLITQHSLISMERCIREAHERYAEEIPEGEDIPKEGEFEIRELDPENNDDDKLVFYNRVHGNVVSTLVQNMMTTTAWDELTLHKERFSFKDLTTGEWSIDGPCLVKTMLMKIDPDTMVGLESLRKKLETARLHQFKNNIPDMLNFMETTYKEIRNNGKTHETRRKH